MDLSTLLAFSFTSFLLALMPGPDNLFVITQGVISGKKASVVTTLGLTTGIIIHTSLAILGVSAIFQTSSFAFNFLKFLGVLYLFYLAYQIFKHRDENIFLNRDVKKLSLKKLYVRGFLMNVLNPKVSLFFLAFFPQFVDKSQNITIQISILGSIFMLITVIVFSSLGILASSITSHLEQSSKVSKIISYITSSIFIILGLKLAFAGID